MLINKQLLFTYNAQSTAMCLSLPVLDIYFALIVPATFSLGSFIFSFYSVFSSGASEWSAASTEKGVSPISFTVKTSGANEECVDFVVSAPIFLIFVTIR